MKKTSMVFLLALTFFSSTAHALNVGVAPSVTDLGTVQPGSRVSGSFYIVTNSDTDLTTNLETVAPPADFFTPKWTNRKGYEFVPELSSEEDATSWISFLEDPVIVPPERELIKEINTYVNKKVDVVLTVPRGAEPGYHAVHILPSPDASVTATGGVGVGIITLAKAGVVFRVPGDVLRNAEIIGFDYERTNERYEEVRVLVKNTGTVTMSVALESLSIDEGNRTVELAAGPRKIKPKGIGTLTARYDVSGKDQGSYPASAKISWTGGNAEKSGTVEIVEATGKPSITGQAIAPVPIPELPLWIAPIFIMFSAILFYWWHNGKG